MSLHCVVLENIHIPLPRHGGQRKFRGDGGGGGPKGSNFRGGGGGGGSNRKPFPRGWGLFREVFFPGGLSTFGGLFITASLLNKLSVILLLQVFQSK